MHLVFAQVSSSFFCSFLWFKSPVLQYSNMHIKDKKKGTAFTWLLFHFLCFIANFFFCPVAQGLLPKKGRRGDRDGTILPWYQGGASLVTNTTEFVSAWNVEIHIHATSVFVARRRLMNDRLTCAHTKTPPSSCPKFVLQQRALHKLTNHRHLTLKQSVTSGSY